MPAFNPNDHLITLQGKKYLEVRWRLVWLRELHPDATIITEILNHNPAEEWAVIRATVVIPDGGGSATGMALQRPTGIAKDYIANGETSAIGRALGALGFGTQFAPEFDQGEQVVDSPVARRPTTNGAAKPEQVAWYGQSMKRYGFTNYDDQLAIAEDIGRAPFDHLTAHVLKGIVDAARATLVAKGEDGRWTIVEPVLERLASAPELVPAMT
jgi:hypothetical protein